MFKSGDHIRCGARRGRLSEEQDHSAASPVDLEHYPLLWPPELCASPSHPGSCVGAKDLPTG